MKTKMLLRITLLFLINCTALKNKTTADNLNDSSSLSPVKRDFPTSLTISPCEDFYAYVCTEAQKKFQLPADRNRWIFSFMDISERLLNEKKKFFKNIETYQPRSERATQFKDVYLACMKAESAASEERLVVAQKRQKILNITTWQELAHQSQENIDQAAMSFIIFDVEPNKEHPLTNDITLTADARSLPERSYYQNPDLIADFKNVLISFFQAIKVDNPEQRAQWVIDFEKNLSDKYPLPNELRKRFTENRSIKKSTYIKKYANLKPDRFLNRLPQKTVLIDFVPEASAFINNALKNYPLEQMKSVFLYHTLANYLDDAYPEFFQKRFDFNHKYLGGAAERRNRQERCTLQAMEMFGMEIDYELVNILYPNFPQTKVLELVEQIRNSITQGIKENKWLQPITKNEAIKKIRQAKLYLVKPKTEKDWGFLPIQKYNDTTPYANLEKYRKTKIEQKISELSENRNPDRWDFMTPLMADAFYVGSDNKFVLPIGILQPPFFDVNADPSENFGAIGAIIGHELGHGIDDQGAKYDSVGKVRNWFTKKDLKEFNSRGEQFITQFNKIGHDGKLTLGENIGDHVGIRFSYNAAFPLNTTSSQESKQKFFQSYARLWCGVATKSNEVRRLKLDPHALEKERTNQQVIHLDGFYEAYNCKKGDHMYLDPKERIRVW